MSGLRLGLAGVLLLWPGRAFAHSTIAGTSGFYAGVLHPLAVPAHLLVLLSLGLWLGQQELRTIERALPGFGLAALAGSLLGALAPLGELTPALLAGALTLGLLVAAERPLAWLAAVLAAAAVGLAVAADSAPPAGDPATARAIALGGTLVGIHLILLNTIAIVSVNRRAWQKIAVRIAGSWIAASAILVLALSLGRPGGPAPVLAWTAHQASGFAPAFAWQPAGRARAPRRASGTLQSLTRCSS